MTPHTWQSMKDHCRKKIVPNINNYGLRKLEVAKLTGTTTQPGLQFGDTTNTTPPHDDPGKITLPCVQSITHALIRVSHWILYNTIKLYCSGPGNSFCSVRHKNIKYGMWIFVASSVLLTVPRSTIADFRSSVCRSTYLSV